MKKTLCTSIVLLAVCLTSPRVSPAADLDEGPRLHTWAGQVFLGEPSHPIPYAPGLTVWRQDHNDLRLRQSVLKTPLQIGDNKYNHGLGTHAVSEIHVQLPRPVKQFTAQVGVDNNYDTAGKRGTVLFVVEVAGKEAFRSELCKGGQPPVPLAVDLSGAAEFTLRVLDGGDGVSWDQADWADAAATYSDGKQQWLDEMPVQTHCSLAPEPPFAFTYAGKSSRELLPNWKAAVSRVSSEKGRELTRTSYLDPQTGLEVTCELARFSEYPAVEWVLRFRNTGPTDTPIIENILPLALRVLPPEQGDIVLHHAHGSTCAPTDFLPIDDTVPPGGEIKLVPAGGRSSNGQLPFVNAEWFGGGLVAAIGWSGQWAFRLHRDKGHQFTLSAGQELTHLILHPGESIRTPRILLVGWHGPDRYRGHNLLRRLILAQYSPRVGGEVALPPVTWNTWFTFNEGNLVDEANQLEAIGLMKGLGVEGYWLDAGWFEGGWPAGAGSWVPRKAAFPKGLEPLGDAAHASDMKFVLWFEPERVARGSLIDREHSEWVLRTGGGDGLFDLGNPAARAWLADYLSKCIHDWGLDVFRNDFNIDPLPFWRKADPPDRQGIAEIRYVEGLYALWDTLCERKPGLVIDNCASGGRRIDLETLSRSMPLWRSDTQCCGKAMPAQDQAQTAGLSLWVPLHAAGVWDLAPYPFRSVATMGTCLCMDGRRKEFSPDAARRSIAELKRLRPLYLSDYYPLLEINVDEKHWSGWQFNRPELGKGFAMFFRRPASPYSGVNAGLRGLEKDADYRVSFSDTGKQQTMKGAALAEALVVIDHAPGSALLEYEKVKK